MKILIDIIDIIELKDILGELYIVHGNEKHIVRLSSIIDKFIIQEQNHKLE